MREMKFFLVKNKIREDWECLKHKEWKTCPNF